MYLPGALQIGVDYGLFWRLTPKKLEPFLKAYESKQKEQLEFINIAGWVNGMYAGYSLGAAFGENVQYPEKPVQIFRSEEEIQENTDWEAEYFRQLTKLLRGALLSTNFWNLVFNRPVDTASTEAEKITLSPFFIGNSKYPGTNKSSLKSYPRFCSSMYSML